MLGNLGHVEGSHGAFSSPRLSKAPFTLQPKLRFFFLRSSGLNVGLNITWILRDTWSCHGLVTPIGRGGIVTCRNGARREVKGHGNSNSVL